MEAPIDRGLYITGQPCPAQFGAKEASVQTLVILLNEERGNNTAVFHKAICDDGKCIGGLRNSDSLAI